MTLSVNITGAPGDGKCHSKGTEILMSDGSIKNVEDIRINDYVMGPNSRPRKVLNVSNGRDELYEIMPTKGEPYKVTKNHILALKLNHHGVEKDILISVEDFLKKPQWFKERCKQYSVGIEFNEQEITLEPYFLGIWLGDGAKSCQRITNGDNEIIEYLEEYSKKIGMKLTSVTNTISYDISNGQNGGSIKNQVIEELKKLNLIHNKHIPNNYMLNLKEIRLQLLAGLIDSDGENNHNSAYITQKSQKLSNDICFLARSLGFASYTVKTIKHCVKPDGTKVKGTYYRTSILGDLSIIPTKVKHKQFYKRKHVKNVLRCSIKITKCKVPEEYYGFEVTGDKLYVMGSFVVTHNSTTALGVTNKLKRKHVNVEYVPEYAKGLTWEERIHNEDQDYIFAKQNKHMKRCAKHVDVIVTDSPLLLSLYYGRDMPDFFKKWVLYRYNEYTNLNYLIVRGNDIPYIKIGRTQTEEESKEIHGEVKKILDKYWIPYETLFRTDESQHILETRIVHDVIKTLER